MWSKRNYLKDAKRHEQVFRNILRSVRVKEEGLSVEEIYQDHSQRGRDVWDTTVLDFMKGPSDLEQLSKNEALFARRNGITIRADKYMIKHDGSVEYDSNIVSGMG